VIILKNTARRLQTIFPVSVKVRFTAHTSYKIHMAHMIATTEINVPIVFIQKVVMFYPEVNEILLQGNNLI
jgi:hypothetical protein